MGQRPNGGRGPGDGGAADLGRIALNAAPPPVSEFGVTPEINALSVCLLLATFTLIGLNAAFAVRPDEASRH